MFLAGVVVVLAAAWLTHVLIQDHLRAQLVERSRLLAVTINEIIEAISDNEEIRFAVEDIVASEEGIAGISIATKKPFVIWASSFHPGADVDYASQQMLEALTETLSRGVFGHYLLADGDLVTIYPLLSPQLNSAEFRHRIQRVANDPAAPDRKSLLGQVVLESEQYKGAIYLRFAAGAINEGAGQVWWRSMALLLAGMGGMAWLVYGILNHKIIKPVLQLYGTVQRQAQGDHQARAALSQKDEIGRLGEAFNRMLDAISLRDRRLHTLLDHLPIAVSLKKFGGPLELVNSRFTRWLGESCDAERRARYEGEAVHSLRDVTFEEAVQQAGGETRYFTTTIFPVLDASGQVSELGSASTDITQRKQAEQEVVRLAYFDILTGLPNRSLFQDRLEQALRHAERQGRVVGLLYLDLDGFKSVNDNYGHEIGDLLLQQTAERLQQAVRVEDTVARMGGDEFTVIVGNLEPASAESILAGVAAKISTAIAGCFWLGEIQTFVTTSIGIALYPDNAADAEQLIVQADISMYHAKKSGRDHYQFYQPEMNYMVRERRQLEDQLRQAQQRHELSVVYQPKVDFASGRLVGAEVLLRWNNAIYGPVSPLRFIPIAEDNGLIIPIGEWVIRTVAGHLAHWRAWGIRVPPVAINLSPRQLRDKAFLGRMDQILRQHKLAADSLEFEITEGVFLQEVAHSRSQLYQLKDYGIGLTIDDFGTGLSSLSYLKKLPVDAVKVDRSFVANLTSDSVDVDIVTAIIAMAHGMKLKVIAEGVETREQYDLLKRLGCDCAQGWLTGEPVSFERFAEVLSSSAQDSGVAV